MGTLDQLTRAEHEVRQRIADRVPLESELRQKVALLFTEARLEVWALSPNKLADELLVRSKRLRANCEFWVLACHLQAIGPERPDGTAEGRLRCHLYELFGDDSDDIFVDTQRAFGEYPGGEELPVDYLRRRLRLSTKSLAKYMGDVLKRPEGDEERQRLDRSIAALPAEQRTFVRAMYADGGRARLERKGWSGRTIDSVGKSARATLAAEIPEVARIVLRMGGEAPLPPRVSPISEAEDRRG